MFILGLKRLKVAHLVLNSQKLLQTLKVARGCSKGKKLLKTPKVAHKLPSTIYKGLIPADNFKKYNTNCTISIWFKVEIRYYMHILLGMKFSSLYFSLLFNKKIK